MQFTTDFARSERRSRGKHQQGGDRELHRELAHTRALLLLFACSLAGCALRMKVG
jgi:hypothetical protein